MGEEAVPGRIEYRKQRNGENYDEHQAACEDVDGRRTEAAHGVDSVDRLANRPF